MDFISLDGLRLHLGEGRIEVRETDYIFELSSDRPHHHEVAKIGLVDSKVPGKQAIGANQGMSADEKIT